MLNAIKKIKNYIKNSNAQFAELEWAHIYKETIRGKKWLEELSISPGRWAGNYSFFYVLTRILSDYKPNKIIEFGLGESSKMISTFINNELNNSTHLIIEQSEDWTEKFNSRFTLSKNSTVINLPLSVKRINNFPVNCYEGIEKYKNEFFDLYVIDGPFGSDHFSRFDICNLAEEFKQNQEFIILFDDYNRDGEKETVAHLIEICNKKKIEIHIGEYCGNKNQVVICTEKFKYAATL